MTSQKCSTFTKYFLPLATMPRDYVYVNTQHPTKEGEILPGNYNTRIQADDHANRPSRMRITPKHETPIQLTLRNLRLHMNKSRSDSTDEAGTLRATKKFSTTLFLPHRRMIMRRDLWGQVPDLPKHGNVSQLFIIINLTNGRIRTWIQQSFEEGRISKILHLN